MYEITNDKTDRKVRILVICNVEFSDSFVVQYWITATDATDKTRLGYMNRWIYNFILSKRSSALGFDLFFQKLLKIEMCVLF